MYLKPKPANRQLLKPKNKFIILYIVLLVKTDNYICKNEQENAKYCPLPFLVVWLFRKCMCAVLHPAYIIYKSSINSLISSAVYTLIYAGSTQLSGFHEYAQKCTISCFVSLLSAKIDCYIIKRQGIFWGDALLVCYPTIWQQSFRKSAFWYS